jgi:acyl carrier protein
VLLTLYADAFIAKLKSSLMMTDENVKETTPLIDLGVDSLVAVEIRTWFAQEIGADVAVLRILGGPSIEELVDDVVCKLGLPTPADEGQPDSDSVPSSESDKDTSSVMFPATGASSVSEVSAVEESLRRK